MSSTDRIIVDGDGGTVSFRPLHKDDENDYICKAVNDVGFAESTGYLNVVGGYSWVNPLRAKFFRGNINIYLHFVSFLHIDTTQVVEILPQIRQEPTYCT